VRRRLLFIATLANAAPASRSAGAVNVLHGSGDGLRAHADQLWTQGTRGGLGAVGRDSFGPALASGSP
jgi:hypothetical protein